MIPIPNWCANLLEVAGSIEDKKRLLDFVAPKPNSKVDGDLSLNSIIPTPNNEWDYDWCSENWGTKWDVEATLALYTDWEQDNANLVFKFDSAWAPPVPVIKKLAEIFPELEFSYLFAEPGMGFSGTEHFNVGAAGESTWFPATNNGNIDDIIAGYIWSYGP
jgi:hypothetical protein